MRTIHPIALYVAALAIFVGGASVIFMLSFNPEHARAASPCPATTVGGTTIRSVDPVTAPDPDWSI